MQTIKIHDQQFAYVQQGQGPVVVLIHGFPLDSAMWQGQIEALSNRYRVIAPDLRGFGQSHVTQGTVTMRDMSNDLGELLDALQIDEAVTVAGLSMGGYVAFQFQRDWPQRVRALILCDTRAESDTDTGIAARQETANRLLREGATFLADTMPAKLLSPTSAKEKPELVESLRRMILRQSPAGLAAVSRGMSQRASATAWLSQIDCPTLVVVGRDDAISPPAEMASLATAIPQAKFVEIPDAGHLSPWEQPDVVSQAMLEWVVSSG